MAGYEWKKLLGCRRFWLVLAILLAELVGLILFTRPYDPALEQNRAAYEDYLASVSGPLTPENREALEAEMQRLSQADREMERLKMDFYSEKISEEAYRTRFAALYSDCQRYPGFAKLYSQYIYVREDPARRYFLYTGGWETLLGDQKPDYLLLLLLILLLPTLFCEEYASGMDALLLTQKRSASRLPLVKALSAVILSAALAGILQLFLLAYCALCYGLPNGSFPLQSLVSFGSTEKGLTLWQGYWLQFFLRELGYIYAAILILALASALKKYALTLMAAVILLILPFFTVSDYSAFLSIPAPWALTLGSIYLNGSTTSIDHKTGERIVRAAGLSGLRLCIFLAVVLGILALLTWYLWQKNANAHLKRRRRRVLSLLVLLWLLTGCGHQAEVICWNADSANLYSTPERTVFNDSTQSYIINHQTGIVRVFPPDAFAGSTTQSPTAFYGESDRLYYWKETRLGTDEYSSGGVAGTRILAMLDLNTGDETAARQLETENTWFFGLLPKPISEPVYLGTPFFLYWGDIFIQENETLYRIGGFPRHREPYLERLSLDIAFDGEHLYYTDQFNRLVIHSLKTGEETLPGDVIASRFYLTPEGIFYLNIRDGNRLYQYDPTSGVSKKLSGQTGWRLADGGDDIWLYGDDALYRIAKDGTRETAVPMSQFPEGTILIPRYGNALFIVDSKETQIHQMDKRTLTWSILEAE